MHVEQTGLWAPATLVYVPVDFEHIQAQVAQVVVGRLGQFCARHGRDSRSVVAAPGADLGDNGEVVDFIKTPAGDH